MATSRKLRSSFRFLALTVTVSPRWPHETLSWAVAERRQKGTRRLHTIHEQRATFPSPGHEELGSQRGCPALPTATLPHTPNRQTLQRRDKADQDVVSCDDNSRRFPAGGGSGLMMPPTWKTAHPPVVALCIDRQRRPRPSSAACGPEAWARLSLLAWAVAVPGFVFPAGVLAAGRPPGWGGRHSILAPAPPALLRRRACRNPGLAAGTGRRRPAARAPATGRRPRRRPGGGADATATPAAGAVRPGGSRPPRPSPAAPTPARPPAWAAGSTRTACSPGRPWPASGGSSPTMAWSGGGRRRGSAPAGR